MPACRPGGAVAAPWDRERGFPLAKWWYVIGRRMDQLLASAIVRRQRRWNI
jgi:hypothetical protein